MIFFLVSLVTLLCRSGAAAVIGRGPSVSDSTTCKYPSFKLYAPAGPAWEQGTYATTSGAGSIGFPGTDLGLAAALQSNGSSHASRFTLDALSGRLYADNGWHAYWFPSLAQVLFGDAKIVQDLRAYEQSTQPVTAVTCAVPSDNDSVFVCDPDGSGRYRQWETCWAYGPLELIEGDPFPPYYQPHPPEPDETECGSIQILVTELECVKSLPQASPATGDANMEN